MTDERIVLPVDPDTNALVNRLLNQLSVRAADNLLRTSYYEGKRAIKQIGTVVPPQYYRLGITLGWPAKGVDLLARRCNLDAFIWPDGDLADLGGDLLFTENAMATEINAAITSALIHGPAFLVNTRGDDNEPESLIHVRSALEATGDWNQRTRALDNLLSVTGRDGDGKVLSLALYLPGQTLVAERDKVGRKWTADWSEHDQGLPAEVLAYKPDPRRPFGRSRITRPVMGLTDSGIRELIRLEGHMDVFSYPELWLLGANIADLKNPDGTMMSIWEARMGRMKGLADDENLTTPRATVQQISAADPTPHLADLNALGKLIARELSLPDSAIAITDVANPTSAESYDASQYELIAEAEGATDDWSTPLRRAFIRGLAIRNGIPVEEVPENWQSIGPKWRNPRYISRAAEADAGLKQLTAVPWLAESEVGLELLGLTEQQIQRALADKRRAQGSVALQQIAAAAQSLTGAAGGNAG